MTNLWMEGKFFVLAWSNCCWYLVFMVNLVNSLRVQNLLFDKHKSSFAGDLSGNFLNSILVLLQAMKKLWANPEALYTVKGLNFAPLRDSIILILLDYYSLVEFFLTSSWWQGWRNFSNICSQRFVTSQQYSKPWNHFSWYFGFSSKPGSWGFWWVWSSWSSFRYRKQYRCAFFCSSQSCSLYSYTDILNEFSVLSLWSISNLWMEVKC